MNANRYRINSISNDDIRFVLTEYCGSWTAERHVKLDNGAWHKDWYSDGHANQVGARRAISITFGL